MVARPTTLLLAVSTISTDQPASRRSPASSTRGVLPMSYQTVPDSAAARCTCVLVWQALNSIVGVHGGSVPGRLLKASVSASVGRHASISPPPSTITALIAGDASAACGVTVATTLIWLADVAPAPMMSVLVQLNRVAPAAPSQVQPGPVGRAARTSPGGSRSLTVYTPVVGSRPALRTLIR